jgi:hypothetical protein
MARDRQTQVNLSRHIDLNAASLRGGAITVRDKALLKPGQFSMVQNVVPQGPGFMKRRGQRKQHSTVNATYTTSMLVSGYQFKKTRVTGDQYLVQSSDGDVQALTTAPPGVTTGDMGTVLYSGTTAPIPASWANLNDLLLYSCGVDQHKLYAGASSYPSKIVYYNSGTAGLNTLTGVLEDGFDYTDVLTDNQTSTLCTLTAMDDVAAGDGIYICTPIPAKSFTFTLGASVNNNATTMAIYYWKNDGTWATVTMGTDGTSAGSAMFAQSGTATFTAPTAILPRYLFGMVGYWYIVTCAADPLDNVTISAITYAADFADLVSMWDGAPATAVSVLVEGASVYDTYAGDSVDLDLLAAGKKIYICSVDLIEGIYIDPGGTPNTEGSTAITSLKYWNGSAWTTVGTPTDGTGGMANAGWILFPRQAAMPRSMEANKIHGYWYELIWDSAISADVVVSISTMPYFDIHDSGYYGQVNCVWKERALWTFTDLYPEYVYISAPNNPQIIVGEQAAIIEVGDGRPHKITAIKNFFNNVLVWQEEKGEIGGCVTMLQGYDVPTFGKLLLSSKLGTFSAKSVDVVENVYTATSTDETLKTIAFFISRYGVVSCDGVSFAVISDDIQNFFDPNDATYCINYNAYKAMWLKHDPVDHVLRLGLACGSSTVPNYFPVYDLSDRCWYFDVRAQELAFWENWEAGSGNVPWVQVGGGVDDGQLYQVNYGTADVSSAIASYIQIELTGAGHYLDLLSFVLQCKAQTGNLTFTTYKNTIAKDTITLSMAAEYSTQEVRRHLISLNVIDQLISLRIYNSSTTESFTLYSVGLEARQWRNR